MTPYIEEALRMLRLAEADYQAFAILRAHPEAPLAPTCFHAQQCVEKALKAVLMAHQVHFRRTHDLNEITSLLERARITPPFAMDVYKSLGPFAVELRYDELLVPSITIETADRIAGGTLDWAREQVRVEPQAAA
ncbi:MAG: HEPN domain-containing protein [Sulfuritalea sp.]|nr:HEPN domain-containing protein [Sulfuritalea sp.]